MWPEFLAGAMQDASDVAAYESVAAPRETEGVPSKRDGGESEGVYTRTGRAGRALYTVGPRPTRGAGAYGRTMG